MERPALLKILETTNFLNYCIRNYAPNHIITDYSIINRVIGNNISKKSETRNSFGYIGLK